MNKKGFVYVLVLLLFTGCAKFGLDNFSLSSTQFVNINGVTGGADATQDVYLFDGNIATIHWVDEPDEDSYDVTLFANDGITIVCALTNVPQNSTTHTFLGCPLVEGRAYWALVEAVRIETVGGTSAKVTSQSVIGNGGFNFLYPPILSLNSLTVNEGIGTANVVASLSAPSDWPLSFDWATSDATAVNSGIFKDYDSRSVTNVVMPAGTTTLNLSVVITDDPRDEDEQRLNLSYSNEIAVKGLLPETGRIAALRIEDNDPPPDLSFTNQTITEGDSTSVITMSLSEISEKVVTFSYETLDGTAVAGTDYISIPATPVMFNPGDNDVSFSIQSSDDVDVCEFDETVGIEITGGTNLGSAPTDVVSIVDNDYPRLTLTGDSVVEGSPLTFTATLSDPCPTETVSFEWATVPITASNGLDLNQQSGTVSFAPNDVVESIEVSTIDDATREVDTEYVSLGARNRINLEDSPAAAVGIIEDNEVGLATVKVVTAGPRSCALSSDGQIKCWGYNEYIGGSQSGHIGDESGEMGDNLEAFDFGTWDHDNDSGTPNIALEVQDVMNSDVSTYVLLSNGRIKGFGEVRSTSYNDDPNEMGDSLPFVDLGTWDHDSNSGTPEINYTVKAISNFAFPSTFCAHLIDDNLKCWGFSNFGQTGQGSTDWLRFSSQLGNNLPPIDFGTWDHDNLSGTPEIQHKVKKLGFPCVILDNDKVKCWGRSGGYGPVGDIGDEPGEMGNNLPYIELGTGRTVKDIAGTCAILDNDDLKCWGNNNDGQLGLGDTNNRGFNVNQMGDNLPVIDLGTYDHDGNSGTPEINHYAKKIFASNRNANCALLDDDRTKCWGASGFINLIGSGGETLGDELSEVGNGLPYLNLGSGRSLVDISFEYYSTHVLRDDNSIVGFGQNKYGELGQENQIYRTSASNMGDNLVPIDLGTGVHAIKLPRNTTNRRKCAVLSDGTLKCWGRTSQEGLQVDTVESMKIGDDPSEMGAALPAIQLPGSTIAVDLFESTSAHTQGNQTGFCAKLNNGNFVCWGEVATRGDNGDRPNSMGNSLIEYNIPGSGDVIETGTSYHSSCMLGTSLDLKCWGVFLSGRDALSGSTSSIGSDPGLDAITALVGTNRKVLSFSKGFSHACALLDNYSVKCWGNNSTSRLGNGPGSKGDSLATSGDNLLATDLGSVSYPVQVVANYDSSCAKFANGAVKCWGGNRFGQLGYGDTAIRGDLLSMGDNLPFIDLGTGRTAKDLFKNHYIYEANCVTRDDDTIVCWGDYSGIISAREDGARSIGSGPGQMGDNLVSTELDGVAQKISSSSSHSCAVLTDNRVKCWGNNKWGQLGLGDLNRRGNAPGEMGVNLPAVNISW